MDRPAWIQAVAVAAVTAGITWVLLGASPVLAQPRDLPDVLAAGTLRHLAVPYAGFVTGGGDGLDVEVVQRFAEYIGVAYEQVLTDWDQTIGDLTGLDYTRGPEGVEIVGEVPVRGDLIAHGMTILAWREELVRFGRPMFPTQVWLLAPAYSAMEPIQPGPNVAADIRAVEILLPGLEVLTKPGTCLDPELYGLADKGARVRKFDGQLTHMAPAMLEGCAATTILDVPDALVALRNFSGRLKIIGPLSPPQMMAPAFAREAVQLREVFDEFTEILVTDGTYVRLVRKYYPTVTRYFPVFFTEEQVHP